MLHVPSITAMQTQMVQQWHAAGITNPYSGFLAIACHQCSLNYQLWHEEDRARDPEAPDRVIAQVKRSIDRLNQQRNDWIEKMDQWISAYLVRSAIRPRADARMNTETPGSVIDRLAILALRIYHLEEQRDRREISAEQLLSVTQKLAICQQQHADLATALADLIVDILAGYKRHQKYCQFKMYNDPTLNPRIHATSSRRAA